MKKLFGAAILLLLTSTQESIATWYPTRPPIGIGSPTIKNNVTVSYNSSSTALGIKFPTTNGGKIEIYRNGSLVVCTNAGAGSTNNYILSNYGKGDYKIVVSNGNTVIYNNNVTVK